MKNFLWFVAGGLFLFGATVFAQSSLFTDDESFADWYSDSVYHLRDNGVINGYEDGSFGPDNYVTRAEMVVMLDRYEDLLTTKEDFVFHSELALNRILWNWAEHQDLDLPNVYKVSVVLAFSRIKYIGEDVSDVYPDFDQCRFKVEGDFDHYISYSLYFCPDEYGSYFVHIEGQESQEDMFNEIDEWYGPYEVYSGFLGIPSFEIY